MVLNMNSNELNQKEVEDIKKIIMDYYHEGHVKADPKLYEEVLHDSWKFFMFDDKDNLKIVDKKEYCSWYDPEKVDTNLQWDTEFFYIDVFEKNAQVKLKIETQTFGYLDYFNLMKINGKWWIVHKLSQKLK